MLSPKVKIGLLVMTHVVGGLLLAWIGRLTDAEIAGAGLFAMTFADAGLLGMWGGLSLSRLGWRVAVVIGASVYLWGVFVVFLDVSDLSLFLVIVLTTVTVLVVLSTLRRGRRQLRFADLANESPTSEGFQFSIRHLLVTTAVVAAVLGIGRVVRPFGKEWETLLIIGILPPCLMAVVLATLWAALGIGRPAPRLAIVLPTAFFVGAIPVFYLGVPSDAGPEFYIWPVIVGLQAIITAASLFVVRSCGWRLVSGGGVQADEQLRPNNQGPSPVVALTAP